MTKTSYTDSIVLTLPEINLSPQEDWGDMSLFSNVEQSSNSESSVSTPGLTRTLSLPRIVKNEENNSVTEVINISTSNPSHLFWVPASQHPEISPAEFQKYVEVHGLNIREKGTKQRQSVLSVSFMPGDDPIQESKDVETERKVALEALERRNNRNGNVQLDESKNRLLIRRSVSLHFPKGDYHEIPDFLVFDRNSSPLDQSQALVPKGDRPLLRRGARNNFKRNLSVNCSQKPEIMNRKSESDCIQEDKHLPVPLTRSASTEDSTSTSRPGISPKPVVPVIIEEPASPRVTDSFDIDRHNEANGQTRKTWSWTSFWSDEKPKKKNDSSLHPPIKPRPSKSSEPSFSGKRFNFSHLFSRKAKTRSTNLTAPPGPPKDFELNRMFMMRLPLHTEKAIYRLSHIKLANPRRPLHEQVLISNHMFWYLSIISSVSETVHTAPVQKPRKLIKKPRPAKKNPTQNQKDPLPSYMKSLESTGFIVPENYLNPRDRRCKSSDKDLDSDPEDLQDDVALAMYKYM